MPICQFLIFCPYICNQLAEAKPIDLAANMTHRKGVSTKKRVIIKKRYKHEKGK